MQAKGSAFSGYPLPIRARYASRVGKNIVWIPNALWKILYKGCCSKAPSVFSASKSEGLT